MIKFEGVYPAIASTFTDTGAFDYTSYTHLIRHLIKGGCHGITLFAIAGEYYKLTYEEELKLIEITVGECKAGGVKSVISVTRHATEIAVEWARYIQDAGADCLMLLPPFFLKPSSQAILDHIGMVAEAVTIPIMLQYAPEQTGVTLSPDLLLQVNKQNPNVSILKIENKPPGAYISQLLNANPDIDIFVGNAGFQMIENFDRGARGILPGCSMFDLYLGIYHHYLNGEREEALHIHKDLIVMLNHIRQNVEMIICFEKKMLKRRGIIKSDYCRKPHFVPDAYHLKLFDEYFDLIKKHFKI